MGHVHGFRPRRGCPEHPITPHRLLPAQSFPPARALVAYGEHLAFDPFSWLWFPVYTDNHRSLYLHSLTLLKHFLIAVIRLPVSKQGPSPHPSISYLAPTDPSEVLTSDAGLLIVAAIPDKPTGGWMSPPWASTPFVPEKAEARGDPPREGQPRARTLQVAGRTRLTDRASPLRALGIYFFFWSLLSS